MLLHISAYSPRQQAPRHGDGEAGREPSKPLLPRRCPRDARQVPYDSRIANTFPSRGELFTFRVSRMRKPLF